MSGSGFTYLIREHAEYKQALTNINDLLCHQKDLYKLPVPADVSIIPIYYGSINSPEQFNIFKGLCETEGEKHFYIYPIGLDFSVQAYDYFVEVGVEISEVEYRSLFKSHMFLSGNFVVTTKTKNWFLTEDFMTNLSCLFFYHKAIDTRQVLSLTDKIRLKKPREVKPIIECGYYNNKKVMRQFKKNIQARMIF